MTNPTFINRPLDDRVPDRVRAELVLIMEEAAEVAQAAAKVLRFGLQGRGAPHDFGIDNHAKLLEEWNDLRGAFDRYTKAALWDGGRGS